ncbi:MAG: histidine phosphatase family protein [Saprospiraceae bacterium]
MERNLYLVRHAKSSWESTQIADYDRNLNDRGFRDAPFMSRLCAAHELRPDAILSSGALRAKTTARYFEKAFGLPETQFFLTDEIYEAGPNRILSIVQSLNDNWTTVYLFGHNPGFTQFGNWCNAAIAELPTCGVLRFRQELGHWSDFSPEDSAFVNILYPKQYFK